MEVTSQSQIKMSTFTVNVERISDLTNQTTGSGILKRQLQNDVSVTPSFKSLAPAFLEPDFQLQLLNSWKKYNGFCLFRRYIRHHQCNIF